MSKNKKQTSDEVKAKKQQRMLQRQRNMSGTSREQRRATARLTDPAFQAREAAAIRAAEARAAETRATNDKARRLAAGVIAALEAASKVHA